MQNNTQLNELYNKMSQSIIDGDADLATKLAEESVSMKLDVSDCIELGYAVGIKKVGELYESGEYFLPQLVQSAEAMRSAIKILEPALKNSPKFSKDQKAKGKIILATVEGDIHDIGKTIVGTVLQANGFEVIDLGASVPNSVVIEKAKEIQPDIIGLSALLTTTMINQKLIIDSLKELGLKDKIKVIVGGAAVSSDWVNEISADGYGSNAVEAVEVAEKLLMYK